MPEWIAATIAASGYAGIALLMLVENLFPPFPSELIMPMAGFAAAQGDLNILPVIVAGTFGSVLGTLPWYYAGRYAGEGRLRRLAAQHGRWFAMTPRDIEAARHWFERHGSSAVLFGRLVPAVRTLISVPAGMLPMRLSVFLLFSALGTFAWTSLLAGAGYMLEAEWQRVGDILNPATKLAVATFAILYLYRVMTHSRRVRRQVGR